MELNEMSEERLKRELIQANAAYYRHVSRIPPEAWSYEPYKSIKDNLDSLRAELQRRRELGGWKNKS